MIGFDLRFDQPKYASANSVQYAAGMRTNPHTLVPLKDSHRKFKDNLFELDKHIRHVEENKYVTVADIDLLANKARAFRGISKETRGMRPAHYNITQDTNKRVKKAIDPFTMSLFAKAPQDPAPAERKASTEF